MSGFPRPGITWPSAVEDSGGQVFNVKAFGASGNGITDDTAAIQAAVTALITAGGGTLGFPPGFTCLVSSIAITNLTGLYIEGGNGATLIGSVPADPPLKLTSCSQFSIRGLQIWHAAAKGWVNPNDGSDPAGVTSTGHGIALFGCTDGTVTENTVLNVTSAGVFVNACTRTTVDANRIESVYGTGIFVCNYLGASTDVSVVNNKINGQGDDAIALVDLTGEAQSVGLIVAHNQIRDAGSRGIAVVGPAYTVVANNTVYSSSNSGILFGTDSTYGTLTSTHADIHDNQVYGAGALGTLRGNGFGIEGTAATPPTLSKVHDNIIDTTHATGVSVAGAGNEICDNHVLNAGGAGIGVGGSDQRYIGNTIESCQTQGFDVLATPLSRLDVIANTARNNNLSQTASTNNFHLPDLVDSVVKANRSYDDNGYTTNAFNLTGASTSNVTLEGNIATGTYIGGEFNLQAGPVTARNNLGYNPVGIITVAVPASGTAVAAASYDRTFYVTAGSSTCTLAIQNGPSPIVPSGGFGTIRVPAGKTATPTYASAPTWLVEGE